MATTERKPRRVYVPTESADDWRRLLVNPRVQWRGGKSAKALALSWEAQPGFPPRVKKALEPVLPGIEPLLVLPEWKVRLDTDPGLRTATIGSGWFRAFWVTGD